MISLFSHNDLVIPKARLLKKVTLVTFYPLGLNSFFLCFISQKLIGVKGVSPLTRDQDEGSSREDDENSCTVYVVSCVFYHFTYFATDTS